MRCQKLMMGFVLSTTLATLAVAVPPTGAVGRPGAEGRVTKAEPGSRAGAGSTAGATAGDRPASGPASGRAGDRAGEKAAGVSLFRGRAFDTCLAPSVDTMRRWSSSDYKAVGVYFGGRGRACPRQPHLSHGWMRAVRGQGWKVLPLYVGSQSPCVISKNKKHVRMGRYPVQQGAREGRDAVKRAKSFGMRASSPLYLDMEAYNYRQVECGKTTLAFVRAWNREVRRSGYVPGFYSSANFGVRHMETARRAGVRDLPSVIWFARWHKRPSLYNEPVLRKNAWQERRIHQYAGNVKERHGGRTLKIDRNLVHAPVARIS
ncbi:DUF1906 domain-containing protein [Streptomyces longisporoflavus]|uniref:DUF1906 domain-containing protein n=1 Tax=Streptomyces longisporoflavus TaxID=28044 RepID=A0ABW7QWU0_9ACTN